MMNHRYKLSILLMLCLFLVPTASAQIDPGDVDTDKIAQTGFKFLEVSTDARAAALGDALTAFENSSSSAMFYNPAGMANLDGQFSAAFGMTQWIADINYNSASAAYNTGGFGVVGVSLVFADYGDDFIGTVASTDEDGFTEYGELGVANPSPTSLAVGVGYAIALTDRFSVGANIKYAAQDLGEAVQSTDGETEANDVSTAAFDFGVLYKTGFRSLNFAMSVRNFAQELQYVSDNFELPLTFNVGVSMDLMDLANVNQDVHSFRVGVEGKRPRDFSEQIKLGGEYTFMNIFSLRGGYTFPTDEQGISLGAGLQYGISGVHLGVNYAYTSFGVFNDVQRFGVNLTF